MGLHRAFAPRPEVVFLVFVLVSVCVCVGGSCESWSHFLGCRVQDL